METATLPPGEALPYKSNGGARKMLVVPFRGSFVGWYRLGWENLKWLIRIKIYDNTFKKSLRKKYSKVIFITINDLQFQLYTFLLLRGGNEFGTRP